MMKRTLFLLCIASLAHAADSDALTETTKIERYNVALQALLPITGKRALDPKKKQIAKDFDITVNRVTDDLCALRNAPAGTPLVLNPFAPQTKEQPVVSPDERETRAIALLLKINTRQTEHTQGAKPNSSINYLSYFCLTYHAREALRHQEKAAELKMRYHQAAGIFYNRVLEELYNAATTDNPLSDVKVETWENESDSREEPLVNKKVRNYCKSVLASDNTLFPEAAKIMKHKIVVGGSYNRSFYVQEGLLLPTNKSTLLQRRAQQKTEEKQ